jgi:hypothetical protein
MTDSSWLVVARVSWTENPNSKGANNIEALMLRDNFFFTSFVQYSATINMESNIIYMVQGSSKSVAPSTINKSGLFPFSFSPNKNPFRKQDINTGLAMYDS